jgi:hypothetical protein
MTDAQLGMRCLSLALALGAVGDLNGVGLE